MDFSVFENQHITPWWKKGRFKVDAFKPIDIVVYHTRIVYNFFQFTGRVIEATLINDTLVMFFNKTSFTWIWARFGLGAPSDTACFDLGLQFDLVRAKKIPTNYCKLTLHAIFTNLIGLLHNVLKLIFFYQLFVTQLL